MKTFKFIDALTSLVLIIVFAIGYTEDNSIEKTIGAYFITGAWQTISMIIHARQKWFTRRYGWRYIYHRISFISLIALPAGSYQVLYVMAPFMIVFYTGLCFTECFVKIRRPLSLIKN